MLTVTSVSGGKTSAYLAANFPFDIGIFALVRTNDQRCKFPDDKIRRIISDKIGAEFVGTLEQNEIIYTILDLEQYLGREIICVSGPTFDDVIDNRGGLLPNVIRRYCTTAMKIEPIFYRLFGLGALPCYMQIGYRANEGRRIINMRKRLAKSGLQKIKIPIGTHIKGPHKGKNKWGNVEWMEPVFPLFDNGVHNDDVINFWKGKPVRFAQRNNCVGCFHRNPTLLNLISKIEPEKNAVVLRSGEKR